MESWKSDIDTGEENMDIRYSEAATKALDACDNPGLYAVGCAILAVYESLNTLQNDLSLTVEESGNGHAINVTTNQD